MRWSFTLQPGATSGALALPSNEWRVFSTAVTVEAMMEVKPSGETAWWSIGDRFDGAVGFVGAGDELRFTLPTRATKPVDFLVLSPDA